MVDIMNRKRNNCSIIYLPHSNGRFDLNQAAIELFEEIERKRFAGEGGDEVREILGYI